MTRTTACAGAAGVMLSMGLGGSAALGQSCEPGWGEGFANTHGINGAALGVARFDDGNGPRIYAAGYFSEASGQPARGFVRWEGDHWAEVGGGVAPASGMGGTGVRWLGVLDDGAGPALFLAGNFTSAGGTPAPSVARWDGRNWSAFGPGFNADLRALALFDDGSGPALHAAGLFTASGQTAMRGVARWNGASWEALGSGVTGPAGPNAIGARALDVFDLGDGPKLYVGGKFSHAGGNPANHIARWNGRQWSPIGPGVFGSESVSLVTTMMMFDHGSGPQLTIAGRFSLSPTGDQKPRVARWTGSQWVQVGADLGDSSPGYVTSLVAFPGPTGPVLYAGGWFAEPSWLSQLNYIARLTDGEWTTVGGGMVYGVSSLITTQEPGGPALYASGSFDFAGDAPASRVARWDGQRWSGFEHGSLGLSHTEGHAACVFDDGGGERVFIGGYFRAAGDLMCNSIAAWDGKAWHNLADGVRELNGIFGRVNALEPYDDGSGPALFATGNFDVAGEGPCFNIARWDGASWSAPGGNGIDGTGYALEVFDDGSGPSLYVAGQFQHAGSATARGLARWDGSAWSGVGNGATLEPGSYINRMQVFDDGSGARLFVGGKLSLIGGVPVAGIARWDGSRWSAAGSGFGGTPPDAAIIFDLGVFDDGAGAGLYAAGRFASVAGVPGRLVARWNGADWQPVPMIAGTAPVGGEAHSLTPFDDGTGPALFVGGNLTLAGVKSPSTGLLKFRNGDWSLPGSGVGTFTSAYDGVTAAVAWRDANQPVLIATGAFAEAGSVKSDRVAEWRGCPSCYADCTADGLLTVADFGCFQGRYVLGEPYADCTGDQQLTVADFGCFQGKYVLGCP